MVNKQEVADVLQVPLNAMLDAMRHFYVHGTIDDAAVLVDGGTATYAIFIAPFACKVIDFTIRVETIESVDGSIDLKKAASGTAIGSGTAVITRLIPTTIGGVVASTNYPCTVLTASDVNHMAAGEVLGIIIGTVGEMTGLVYSAKIERLN